MADEPPNLVLEILRDMRTTLRDVARDVADLRLRYGVQEQHMAGFLVSDVRQNGEIDRLNARMERIERRLELVDGD